MKAFIPALFSVSALVLGGALLYSRLGPSLETKPAKAPSELEASLRMPPATDNTGSYPTVNSARLKNVAGENLEGISHMVSVEEMNQMVAEQKAGTSNRLPANEAPTAKKEDAQ